MVPSVVSDLNAFLQLTECRSDSHRVLVCKSFSFAFGLWMKQRRGEGLQLEVGTLSQSLLLLMRRLTRGR